MIQDESRRQRRHPRSYVKAKKATQEVNKSQRRQTPKIIRTSPTKMYVAKKAPKKIIADNYDTQEEKHKVPKKFLVVCPV